jgi:pilus assembly protein CpaF
MSARRGDSIELSPLMVLERAVQDQAKELGLDPEQLEGRRDLESLVRQFVERWRIDYERGDRDVPIADPDTTIERAVRNIAGYGPLEPLLSDDDVYEIMINSPSAIFVKRHSRPSGYHDEIFHDDDHVVRTLTKILDDASRNGANRKLDPSEGLQDAQLDSGARLHIVHQDVGRDSHLIVNIRKFTGVNIRSLNELVQRDMLDAAAADFLRLAVRSGATVVMAGSPGSGKTTLLSCMAAELDPSLRVVVAEEVFEADIPLANVASMQTRTGRPDRKEVDLRRLVAGFLRMAPDVAIVGEVRDREVLPLLLTLSSGIQGFTTVHAGSARQALTRLRFIAQLADTSNEIPMAALNSLISEAIDLVVHVERTPFGLQVQEVIAIEEQSTGADAVAFTVTDVFRRAKPGSPLSWTGQVPARLARMFERRGNDLRRSLHAAERIPANSDSLDHELLHAACETATHRDPLRKLGL